MPDPEPQRTDFIECIRTRQKFALNEVNGHRSCTLVNMAALALRLNRKVLNYDPVKGIFTGDPDATAMINQPMRGEWHL